MLSCVGVLDEVGLKDRWGGEGVGLGGGEVDRNC